MWIPPDRRYFVVDAREIDVVTFEYFLETGWDTCLYSNDGTQSVLKYDDPEPSYEFVYPVQGPYNIEEIFDIVHGPDWPQDQMDTGTEE